MWYGHLFDVNRPVGPLKYKLGLADNGRHCDRDLHLGKPAAQTAMSSHTKSRKGSRFPMLRPPPLVAVDIEALRMWKALGLIYLYA